MNRILFFLGCCSLTSSLLANNQQFGVTLPVLLYSKDPVGAHAYRAVGWYKPAALTWGNVNLYFAAGVGHWWANGATQNRSLNIYALVPVLRYYLNSARYFTPYVEISAGPAYMTRTRFSDRNLGMHYAFQDEATLGAYFGKDKDRSGAYVALSILHYSNCSMAAHNAGITAPLILNMGYQFG